MFKGKGHSEEAKALRRSHSSETIITTEKIAAATESRPQSRLASVKLSRPKSVLSLFSANKEHANKKEPWYTNIYDSSEADVARTPKGTTGYSEIKDDNLRSNTAYTKTPTKKKSFLRSVRTTAEPNDDNHLKTKVPTKRRSFLRSVRGAGDDAATEIGPASKTPVKKKSILGTVRDPVNENTSNDSPTLKTPTKKPSFLGSVRSKLQSPSTAWWNATGSGKLGYTNVDCLTKTDSLELGRMSKARNDDMFDGQDKKHSSPINIPKPADIGVPAFKGEFQSTDAFGGIGPVNLPGEIPRVGSPMPGTNLPLEETTDSPGMAKHDAAATYAAQKSKVRYTLAGPAKIVAAFDNLSEISQISDYNFGVEIDESQNSINDPFSADIEPEDPFIDQPNVETTTTTSSSNNTVTYHVGKNDETSEPEKITEKVSQPDFETSVKW